MATENENLLNLRDEIDDIDNAIQDLLNKRADVVDKVRVIKEEHESLIKIRPAREAEILYRLMKRQNGRFPKQEMARIWRELIVATIKFEGPFSLAIFYTDKEREFWDLARDQYGCFTPTIRYSSARRVVEAVQNGEATVGLVPVPRHDDNENWWRFIVSTRVGVPKIAARLPFIGARQSQDIGLEALVIGVIEHEKTDSARSFIAIEANEDVGFNVINNCLSKANLSYIFQQVWHDLERPPGWLYFIELSNFLDQHGPQNNLLTTALQHHSLQLIHLGGYAMPLSSEMLEPNS